jgi:hypothetical protein
LRAECIIIRSFSSGEYKNENEGKITPPKVMTVENMEKIEVYSAETRGAFQEYTNW